MSYKNVDPTRAKNIIKVCSLLEACHRDKGNKDASSSKIFIVYNTYGPTQNCFQTITDGYVIYL